MFANFTEETCTGTGATLALAGATTGSIVFSESFADGELVSYVLEDSGGTIKVAGIGTYVSATDDITRNDTWNWNGTAVDKNPSTNITLSGGIHTIRCDVSVTTAIKPTPFTLSPTTGNNNAVPDNWIAVNDGSGIITADNVYYTPVYYASEFEFNTLTIGVGTADASTVTQIGICGCGIDGYPDSNAIEIVTADVTATGTIKTTLAATHKLPAGRYFTFLSASDDTARYWNVVNMSHGMRSGSYVYRGGTNGGLRAAAGASSGIITTPLVAVTGSVDPNFTFMVLPEMV